MIRLTSLTVSFALVVAGCHDDDAPAQDSPTDTSSEPETSDPERVLEPGDLAAASWPEDLHRIIAFETDAGVVIDGLNHDGETIARVELTDINGSPTVFAVRTTFADMHSWALVDLSNNVLVQYGTEPSDDATVTEITTRAQAMFNRAQGQAPDPSEPQPGPWLDCALSVLSAVFACLPILGGGWLGGCPKAIIDAYCKCWSAKKKNQNKPTPAVCQSE